MLVTPDYLINTVVQRHLAILAYRSLAGIKNNSLCLSEFVVIRIDCNPSNWVKLWNSHCLSWVQSLLSIHRRVIKEEIIDFCQVFNNAKGSPAATLWQTIVDDSGDILVFFHHRLLKVQLWKQRDDQTSGSLQILLCMAWTTYFGCWPTMLGIDSIPWHIINTTHYWVAGKPLSDER